MSFKHSVFSEALMLALGISAMLFLCGCSGSKEFTINGNAPLLVDNAAVIDKAGTYTLTGNLKNGQLVVDPGKGESVTLVLDGLSISKRSGAAINIKSGSEITLELKGENKISSDGGFISEKGNNVDAAIFAKSDILITGDGSLNLDSSANGITVKDKLLITDGNICIISDAHAIEAKDEIEIIGGKFTLTSEKDAIHAENKDDLGLGSVTIDGGDFNITSNGDGISAGCRLLITGGKFDITTADGSLNLAPESRVGAGLWGADNNSPSAKALKSDAEIIVSGGEFSIDSRDDALHSLASLAIDGGNFKIKTSDDALHSDELVTVNGGKIDILRCYEGVEANNIEINGGEITLISADDGINVGGGNDASRFDGADRPSGGDLPQGSVVINGGYLNINAFGDGIDSNGNLTVNGGDIYVSGSENDSNGAIDYNIDGEVNGGRLIALGSLRMAQGFDSPDSKQPSILVSFNRSTDSKLTVLDNSGKELYSFTPDKSYQSALISLPDFKIGEAYKIVTENQAFDIKLISLTNVRN